MGKLSKIMDDVHLTAFTDKVGAQSDNLYRFAYAVLLDMGAAYEVVKGVVEFAAKQIDAVQVKPESDVKNLIFKECWQLIKNRKVNSGNKTLTDQLGKLASLGTEQRAMIILSDFIGFRAEEASDILGVDQGKSMKDLIVARKALIGK